MIFIDGHVHVYHLSGLGRLLDAAWHNFRTAAARAGADREFSAVLLLAEVRGGEVFGRLAEWARHEAAPYPRSWNGWSLKPTAEPLSLTATSPCGNRIDLVAGGQSVTAEGLEVLSLFTDRRLAAGAPAAEWIPAVWQEGGIPVIPWGFGKWTGRRGKLLQALLQAGDGPPVYLGDNGGRPRFAGDPDPFRITRAQGLPILPGSDPLPVPADHRRVGSFGFRVAASLSRECPARALKRLIREKGDSIRPYGAPMQAGRFLFNQSMALMHKYLFRARRPAGLAG